MKIPTLTTLHPFRIIDSTLREGEQFVSARFDTDQKLAIAQALDEFGVEYLELTSPAASHASRLDILRIAELDLKASILTHIRCSVSDAQIALDLPLQGINMVIGTSALLREYSHGKDISQVLRMAEEVIGFVKRERPDLEVRFSTEDSFRSRPDDLFRIYRAVDGMGVLRVGVADTVGIATPFQVFGLISHLSRTLRAGIEFHGHNDSGCAIANSQAALQAGAGYIDTSVLGIGERNGITSLGGLIARLYTIAPESVMRYDLKRLPDLDHLIARMVEVDIPFNNYVTGSTAFSHKAGIHTKAVLNNPQTYESLNPDDFGLTRQIAIAHKLTGRHAIEYRAGQLGLHLGREQIVEITTQIKTLADNGDPTLDDLDAILLSRAGAQAGDAAQAADLG